jgi:hypothetical protein
LKCSALMVDCRFRLRMCIWMHWICQCFTKLRDFKGIELPLIPWLSTLSKHIPCTWCKITHL